ncbi:MAG: universal stress protein, partial [Lysobacter sp.]
MIKDLVIPITNTAGDSNAVAAAMALAAREDAHLALLEIVNLPVPAPSPWGLLPDLAMNDIYNTLRAKAESNAAAWRERLSRESISSEVRVTESLFVEPSRTAALHGRYSDLTVMTAATDDARDMPVIHAFFAALLLEAGRPVLVVPPRFTSHRAARHVVVAWRPTRDATRALHDALPLLRSAESVDVVEVDPQAGEKGDGSQPGADIATHLARHGLKVRVVVQARAGETVAKVLLQHAQQSGADMVVAGGYGHSRFREWMLG